MSRLVTGAFGGIGSWVGRGLFADGERPGIFDLGDNPWRMRMIAGADVASRVTIVRGDIADRAQVERVAKGELITVSPLDGARDQKDRGPRAATSRADGVRPTLGEFGRLQKGGRLDARELG